MMAYLLHMVDITCKAFKMEEPGVGAKIEAPSLACASLASARTHLFDSISWLGKLHIERCASSNNFLPSDFSA
jgi:hypothetical protein